MGSTYFCKGFLAKKKRKLCLLLIAQFKKPAVSFDFEYDNVANWSISHQSFSVTMKRYCFTFILTALNIIAFPSSIALRSNAKHGKSRKKSKAGKATKSKYKFHKSYSKSSRNGELSNQSLVPSRIPSIERSIQSSTRSSLSKMPSIHNISHKYLPAIPTMKDYQRQPFWMKFVCEKLTLDERA